jgi:hypothetical protein
LQADFNEINANFSGFRQRMFWKKLKDLFWGLKDAFLLLEDLVVKSGCFFVVFIILWTIVWCFFSTAVDCPKTSWNLVDMDGKMCRSQWTVSLRKVLLWFYYVSEMRLMHVVLLLIRQIQMNTWIQRIRLYHAHVMCWSLYCDFNWVLFKKMCISIVGCFVGGVCSLNNSWLIHFILFCTTCDNTITSSNPDISLWWATWKS